MQAKKTVSERERDGSSDVLRTLLAQKTSYDWEMGHPAGSGGQSCQNSGDKMGSKFHQAIPPANMNSNLLFGAEHRISGKAGGKIRQRATYTSNAHLQFTSKSEGIAKQPPTQTSNFRPQVATQCRVRGKLDPQCSNVPSPSQNKVKPFMADQTSKTRLRTCEQSKGEQQPHTHQESRNRQGSTPKNACGASCITSNSTWIVNDRASIPPLKRPSPSNNCSARTRAFGGCPLNSHRLGSNGVNVLVGRRLESFWEDNDPHWVEAIVTDYQLDKRLHCLTYDLGTPNESWEWVDLGDLFREGLARMLPGRASVGWTALALAGDSARATTQAQKPRQKRCLDDSEDFMEEPAVRSKKLKGVTAGSMSDRRTKLDEEFSRAGASLLERRLQPGEGQGSGRKGGWPQAPFDGDFFAKKLQEGNLGELEAMLESVTKRRRVVMDELMKVNEDLLKNEDPMVVDLVRLEQLEKCAKGLEQTVARTGS